MDLWRKLLIFGRLMSRYSFRINVMDGIEGVRLSETLLYDFHNFIANDGSETIEYFLFIIGCSCVILHFDWSIFSCFFQTLRNELNIFLEESENLY